MWVRKKGSAILNKWDDTTLNRLRLKPWNMEEYNGEIIEIAGSYYVPGHIVTFQKQREQQIEEARKKRIGKQKAKQPKK